METLDEARAMVRRFPEKPHRMYRTLRDEAQLRNLGEGNPRRRLTFIAARVLELLELDDDALRQAVQDSVR